MKAILRAAAALTIRAIAVALVGASSPAAATSCIGPLEILREEWQNPTMARRLAESKLAIHARVNRLLANGSAEVQVLESFKGAKGLKTMVVTALPRSASMMGTSFSAGEETIIITSTNLVHLCEKIHPHKALLALLRQHAEK